MAFADFKTDTTAETEGVWLDFGGGDGALVARAGGSNQAYKKALELFHKKHKHQLQTDTLSEEVAKKGMREIFAKTVLLELKGAVLDDGTPVTDKSQYAEWLEQNENVYNNISDFASKLSNYRTAELEADAKN